MREKGRRAQAIQRASLCGSAQIPPQPQRLLKPELSESLRPGARVRRLPGAGLPSGRGPGALTGTQGFYESAAAWEEGCVPGTSWCACQNTHICTVCVCVGAMYAPSAHVGIV